MVKVRALVRDFAVLKTPTYPLLLVEPLFEFVRRQPVRGILVHHHRIHVRLIFRIGDMAQMEKVSCRFAPRWKVLRGSS
jgi:hypothetical protein